MKNVIHFLNWYNAALCRPTMWFVQYTNIGKKVTCLACKKKMKPGDFKKGVKTK